MSVTKKRHNNEKILFYNGLVLVQRENKFGFINEKGVMQIQPLYDYALPFLNGIAHVSIGSNQMIINTDGVNLLTRTYDGLRRDPQTGFVLYRLGNKFGLLNDKAEGLTEPIFDNLYEFSDSLAGYRSGTKYGFINTKGEVEISAKYDFIGNFVNGLARVGQGDKVGYIDKKGDIVIPFEYDDGLDFDKSERAIVEHNTQYQLISKNNDLIITGADEITSSGVLYAVEKDGVIKLHKSNGALFNSITFSDVWFFEDYFGNFEYLGVNSNVLFNDNGEIIHHAPHSDSRFIQIFVGSKKTVGLVEYTETNSFVYYNGGHFTIEGHLLQNPDNNRLVVYRNKKIGIIDKNNNIILNFLYQTLTVLDDGHIIFMTGNRLGAMNSKYKTIIEPVYSRITPTFVVYSDNIFL